MKYLLLFSGLLSLLIGLSLSLGAKSSPNAIEGVLLLLVAAVCLSGFGVIDALQRVRGAVASAFPVQR